jgi:hypothetical protein
MNRISFSPAVKRPRSLIHAAKAECGRFGADLAEGIECCAEGHRA